MSLEMRFRKQNRARLMAAAVAVPLFVVTALAAFAWPSARLEPRDLPFGIAGPPSVASALEERVAQRGGAFDLHRYADETAARAAIEDREVYGALVASAHGTTLLTASAASPVVAQLLEEAFALSDRVRVIDVVPADDDDPRGVALNSLVLPLTLVSVIVGLMSVVLLPPGFGRVAGLVGSAMLAGLVTSGIVQAWLGVVPGDWWLNAGVLALLVVAIGAAVAGLAALLGHRGLAVAAALLVFCGNPWSGVSTAPELLPEWVGLTGQLLPPGAGGSVLRSTAFFDGGGSAAPAIVLLVWTVLGLAAVWTATLRDRHPAREGATEGRERPLLRQAG
jgi:hypothetical protein